jgi:hypothetical protein
LLGWALYVVVVLLVFLRPTKAPAKPADTPPPGTPPASSNLVQETSNLVPQASNLVPQTKPSTTSERSTT